MNLLFLLFPCAALIVLSGVILFLSWWVGRPIHSAREIEREEEEQKYLD